MFEKSPCGLVMWNIVGNGKIPDMLPHFMDSPPEGLARSKLAVMNRMEDPIVAEVRASLNVRSEQLLPHGRQSHVGWVVSQRRLPGE